MPCERYREALADVAAGAPAPAAVEAHLASCGACRAELRVLQRALAVADAEMAGLLAAEPTPELAVRIRQAVAEAESRGPALSHELSSAWRFGWLWPATAAAATLLVALAVALGRGTESTPAPRVAVSSDRPEPTGSTRVPEPRGEFVIPRDSDRTGPEGSAGTADTSSPGPADAPRGDRVVAKATGELPVRARDDGVPTRAPSADRRAIPAEPEVLVPPGETEALLRFAALLQRRAVAPDSLLVADLSAPLAEPRAVELAPLVIIPLDPAETSGTD
jgi:anti-sigma factor RsiW